MRASLRPSLCAAVLLLTGCTIDSPGLDPPGPRSLLCGMTGKASDCRAFYFPAGIVLAHSGDGLYVANSNFDLRYNGATVIALDPDAIAAAVRDESRITSCGAVRCIPDVLPFDRAEVRTGSYASGMGISGDDARIYVSVRAEGSLTWIDVKADGTLQCWDDGQVPGVCDQKHRHGDADTYANTRALVLPGDPVRLRVVPASALDATATTGDVALLADRTGAVTLFFDDRSQTVGPAPISVLTGLHRTVAGLGFEPATQRAWVTDGYDSANPTALLSRVGVAMDPNRQRSYLYDAGKVALAGLNDGTDIRDVVFDTRPGSRRMYLLARSPQALVIADLALRPDLASTLPVLTVVPVDLGPSRLQFATVGAIGGIGGRALVFVSCYDARTVNVIDADTGELVTVVRGLGGPYDMAVDEYRSLLYVTDFRSSTLRVVDLAPLAPGPTDPPSTGALDGELIVTSLGNPTPPQALM